MSIFRQLGKNFPARAGDDHTAVLLFVLADSMLVIAGFGTNSYRHISQFGLDYPLIVHLHAVTFMSWLVLFNVQVWLIRLGKADRHRQLGAKLFWLACAMLVIGPATALIRGIDLAPPGAPPVFIAGQFTDIIAFGSLTFAALAFRGNAAVHKRLMLMALFYLSDAGFARFANQLLAASLGVSVRLPIASFDVSVWALLIVLYGWTNIFALALGAYDLIRYRRLHAAYLAALVWILALQALALLLLPSPGWAEVVRRIYGL